MTTTLNALLQSRDIVPLRVKFFHAYATDLIGTKVYDSTSADQILGTVENFLFAPVPHTYDDKSDGGIVGIKISDSKYPVLNPKSVYWWLTHNTGRKFAVLKGKPKSIYNLDSAIAIGDVIRRGNRRFPLVEATVYGSIFGYLEYVGNFPNTKGFPSEYEFVDEVYLDYGDKTEPKRWIAIKRWDMPKAIDFENRTLTEKPTELGLITKEQVDETLEKANTPSEGAREWGAEGW